MRKYANLPGITHIDAIEQPNQGDFKGMPRTIATQVSSIVNN
jgi:hypothetical protein